jgi:hypothetical protein
MGGATGASIWCLKYGMEWTGPIGRAEMSAMYASGCSQAATETTHVQHAHSTQNL